MHNASEKGFTAIDLILVAAVICLIGFAGWCAYQAHQNATSAPASAPKAATVNTWTAKGTDDKFSDAKNWSLGKPKNGQDLTINTDTVATDSANGQLNDDMPGLSIGRLSITGSKNSVSGIPLTISGQPLTITRGISNQLSAPGSAIIFKNNLILQGKQTVSVTAQSSISFNGQKLDIGSSEVTFSTAPDPDAQVGITIGAPLVGSGTLAFIGENTLLEQTDGDLASPDFTGTADIKAGGLVSMFGSQALGKGTIQVENGGTLALTGTERSAETLTNTLMLAGNGVTATGHGGGTGATLGALSACLTSAQQGCTNSTLNLTGATKLTAGAQLGQLPDGQNFSITYNFSHRNTNSYTLMAVPGSQAKITQK